MGDVRWLSAAEQDAWRAFLGATGLLFDALDRQMQRDREMPHGYYEILVHLSEAPGRTLRMSELAKVTHSSRSRLSHAIARLQERGWVERVECLTDRRGQLAHLTDSGFTVLAAAAPEHVAAVREAVFDRLTPEQVGQLRDIADTIRDGLEGN